MGRGLRRSMLPEQLEIRFRHGGERCRPAGRRHYVTLKRLLQQSAVPPWKRAHLPLIYIGKQLAAVTGVCVCDPFANGNDEEGMEILWQR